jgi:hypothetical protein
MAQLTEHSSRLATYHRLSVAILSIHRQIEPEQIAVDNVDVASFRSTQSINPPIKRLVSPHLHGDLRVLTVDRHCNIGIRSR